MTVAEELDQVKSHQVGLISRPNLALEHLARQRFQWDVPGLLSLELSAVAVVHLLNDEWDPADRGFGEAELQFGMALQGSEGEHIYERVEKRSSAIAEPHIEDPLALTGFHRVNRGPDRSRLCAATDVVRHDDAGVLRRVPKHVPWLLIHSESHIVDQKVRFAEAQLCDADDFIPGGLRVDGREHGNGIEALRRALTELYRPVVVSLNAGISQLGLAHLHGDNRRKHERRLDSVAIHISEPFFRRRRPVGFANSAPVESQLVSIGPGKPALAMIVRLGLAIAHPVLVLLASVFDVRRTIFQRIGQAVRPQVLGQIPQVNVIVG